MLLHVIDYRGEDEVRAKLYRAYATQHAGLCDGGAASLVYRRDIRPLLPAPQAGPVLDIGCGQGGLVRLLRADGYLAEGVDISPEQVALARSAGLGQVVHGDYRDLLHRRRGELAAVLAIDLLEHLTKAEVLETFELVERALGPDGVFAARVPNSASPFAGHIRYGDFTHECSFAPRSVRQLAAAAGFESVAVLACPPVVHGPMSAARAVLWKGISAVLLLALTAETGQVGGHVVTANLMFAAKTRRSRT